jgi:hypothetical protein
MGRGGSRFGAGRPGWRGKAEHCLRLEVRALHKAGALRPGATCTWTWRRGGEQTGNVGLRAEASALIVLCAIDGKNADHRLTLDSTPCHFGGARAWFRCPQCFRRSLVLYLRGGAPFRCRHCARVSYTSQSEDAMARTWRKQRKLEARLGEHGARPKGMHWRTFERLHDAIQECEERRDLELASFMRRMKLKNLL